MNARVKGSRTRRVISIVFFKAL